MVSLQKCHAYSPIFSVQFFSFLFFIIQIFLLGVYHQNNQDVLVNFALCNFLKKNEMSNLLY